MANRLSSGCDADVVGRCVTTRYYVSSLQTLFLASDIDAVLVPNTLILIVPPIVQKVVFRFAATQAVKNVPIGILNQGNGLFGRDLAARVSRLSKRRRWSRWSLPAGLFAAGRSDD
ncbi:hypothetical protein NHH03_13845 [Stieleria sp. TO1_6]|uniref:hypothetical protein n=1 Tax=Stieleria tagensis TaxID=2956795 RepID=UPI00209B4EEC|nr:hypothetical protein [Stieleria tagensis]MCO8122826.1 hypothetical protein [Stieleria tagensis]